MRFSKGSFHFKFKFVLGTWDELYLRYKKNATQSEVNITFHGARWILSRMRNWHEN